MDDAVDPLKEAQKLLEELKDRRIVVSLNGDKLKVSAPVGKLDDEVKTRLRDRRDAVIEVLKREAELSGAALAQRPRTNPFPLSYAQKRLWFLERVNVGSTAYVIAAAGRISGAFDERLFGEAFARLSQRHEAFRMRFGEAGGEPFAEVLDELPNEVEVVDASGTPEDDRVAEATRIIDGRIRQPMDLQTGPLARLTLIRFADDDHVLLTRIHHIVSDGWSLGLINRELMEVYDALRSGREPSLSPVEAHCVDHALWEKAREDAGRWQPSIDYWKTELGDAPALTELPVDRPHTDRPTYRGSRLELKFDRSLRDGLQKAAQKSGATLYMTMLGALQVLLHRHSGQEDVLIGTPVANRTDPRLANTVGCLINNVVLRGDLGRDMPFSDYVREVVKPKLLGAHEHSELPFDVVVDKLKPERTASHAPIFQVLFTLMSFNDMNAELDGIRTDPFPVQTGTTRFDISVEMVELKSGILVTYESSDDLFDRQTVRALHDRFEQLLRAIVEAPETPVSQLRIVSDADAALMERLSSAETLGYDRGVATNVLVDRVAAETPERLAVKAGETALDYASLVQRANGLAELLVGKGAGKGSLVAVALDADCELAVAMLAAWKCGAAYVPLDPHHPAERLSLVLEDAAPALVLTSSDIAGSLPDTGAEIVSLDTLSWDDKPDGPSIDTGAGDLAYVIYTSGSTGRPKGVEVEHGNLVSFLAAMRVEPGLKPDDRLLSVTTPSFDIAGLEIWLPLTTGAACVFADRAQRLDGRALSELLSAEKVTVMQATPATWRLLIDSGWAGMLRLKALCGGEAMPKALAEALQPRVSSLWNMYGPTETTIWSTAQKIETAEDAASIGKPIRNTRVAIVGADGKPLPPGVVGELCIAGDGVARGYRDRPDLTADRFVTMTFPGGDEVRTYRTGDLARQRSDGTIAYLGRNDFQVKVRGFRIELGEIESRLSAVPGVTEGVVNVHVPDGGQAALAAYVVAGEGFSEEKARAELRRYLPEYMVPSWFVRMDEIPLTPNRKVDRKALPAPAPTSGVAEAAVIDETAMSPAERRVASIWCELLGLRSVGLNQSFFDVGGHSMLLVKLHEKLVAEFGSTVPMIELFRLTTVATQAQGFQGGDPEAEAESVSRARQRAEQFTNA